MPQVRPQVGVAPRLLLSAHSQLDRTLLAAVTFSPERVNTIRRRRETYRLARSADNDLWTLSFWDAAAWWLEDLDLDEVLSGEAQKQFDVDEWAILPASFDLENHPTLTRTETDMMIIDDSGLWWCSELKHTDIRIESVRITWEVFDACFLNTTTTKR